MFSLSLSIFPCKFEVTDTLGTNFKLFVHLISLLQDKFNGQYMYVIECHLLLPPSLSLTYSQWWLQCIASLVGVLL